MLKGSADGSRRLELAGKAGEQRFCFPRKPRCQGDREFQIATRGLLLPGLSARLLSTRLRAGSLGSDRGSVLMLMPACVLVVLVLASIAVDMSLVHLRQRQASDLAAAAANDAATAGVDPSRLREGAFSLDPTRVRRVVEQAVAASELAPHLVGAPQVTVSGGRVEVVVDVQADYLFSAAMPGAPDGTVVSARASAVALEP